MEIHKIYSHFGLLNPCAALELLLDLLNLLDFFVSLTLGLRRDNCVEELLPDFEVILLTLDFLVHIGRDVGSVLAEPGVFRLLAEPEEGDEEEILLHEVEARHSLEVVEVQALDSLEISNQEEVDEGLLNLVEQERPDDLVVEGSVLEIEEDIYLMTGVLVVLSQLLLLRQDIPGLQEIPEPVATVLAV